jgi:cobalt transporter subunit CbtA
MLGRVLLAAILSGFAAGLILGVIQHVRLTPMILAAEMVETGAPAHGEIQDHDADSWLPADGIERTFYAILTSALTGAGFAAMLSGLSLVLTISLTAANGVFWGLCGFLAVSLAPAAGLPPELPGMVAGDVQARIFWWLLTVVCTAAALWLALVKRKPWTIAAALALVFAPHIIGAPHASVSEIKLTPSLVQTFVANSLAINALFWCLLGLFLGHAMDRVIESKQQ